MPLHCFNGLQLPVSSHPNNSQDAWRQGVVAHYNSGEVLLRSNKFAKAIVALDSKDAARPQGPHALRFCLKSYIHTYITCIYI